MTAEPDKAGAIAEAALRQEGVEVQWIRAAEPTLEDVIVSVMKEGKM